MINKILQFLEPALLQKKIIIKAMIPAIALSVIGIFTVYLVKEITNKLEAGWNSSIISLLILFISLTLILYIILYVSRSWTYATVWPTLRKELYKKYLNLYI
jgi:ABC-type bacteriocin/lantibiotic exporter with double-glycine peptidase domain